jgi:TonB family protein
MASRHPTRLKVMALRTLVFSSDERAVQVLTQHLAEFDLEAKVCPNIFSALENLAKYRFDGIIADWNDDPEATFLIKRSKELDLNRGAMVLAVVRNEGEVARAYDAGAKAILLRPLDSGEIREALTKARPYMLERVISEQKGPAVGPMAGISHKAEIDGEVMPIASPMAQMFTGRWQSEPPAFDQNAKAERSFYEAAKRSRIPKLLLGGLALIAVSPFLVRWSISIAPKAQSEIHEVAAKLRGNDQLAPRPAIDDSFDTSKVATSPSGRVRVVTSYGVISAGVARLPFRREGWPDFALQVDRPNIPVRPRPSGRIPESIQRSAPIEAGHPVDAGPSPVMPGVAEPIEISEASARQLIEHSVDPTYPREALSAGIQGAVVLQARISRDGSVRELHLMDGYFVLGRAVLLAVKQWRFRPYLVNGRAVEADTILTFNFRLPTVSDVAQ